VKDSTQYQTSWNLSQIWNDSLLKRTDRLFEPRDYIYAAELGGSYVDRYLKMTAVTPTNPPNDRSFRKFEAGDLWEGIVKFILNRAGIMIKHQEDKLYFEYPNTLSVHGRLDFIAGGMPDWEKAKASAVDVELMLGEKWKNRTLYVIEQLQKKYNKGLKEIILEVKSCSSYMFEVYQKTNKPNLNHALQTYHYLKSKNMDEGHVLYICKDDCMMLEFGIQNPSDFYEEAYRADIEQMTKYYRAGIQPPIEAQILFNSDLGKFQKNWKVEYSNYLQMLYGYKEPIDYRNEWDSKVASFNRVIGRIVNEDKMTDKNKEAIATIKGIFPNSFDEIVSIAKKLKAENPPEENIFEKIVEVMEARDENI
jgi:hypothetical protein